MVPESYRINYEEEREPGSEDVRSWASMQKDIGGGSRASSGDLEAWPSGVYSGANPFAAAVAREDLRSQPILEDDGRPSIDMHSSSHAGGAEEVLISDGIAS